MRFIVEEEMSKNIIFNTMIIKFGQNIITQDARYIQGKTLIRLNTKVKGILYFRISCYKIYLSLRVVLCCF